MFVLMLLGLWAARRRWIGPAAVTGMTNILIYFVVPCVIVDAFNQPYSAARMHDLGWSVLIDALTFPVAIGVAYAVFRGRDPDTRRALRFGAIYSNSMFLGIPLVQALLGSDGVFFTIAFLTVFNVIVWSHGFGMFSADGSAWRRMFSTPALPAVAVGLLVFVFSVPLPGLLSQGLGYMAGMNAPLSMLVVGASLAQVSWRGLLTDLRLWAGVAVRNVLLPVVIALALWPVPLPQPVRLAILIPLACPVAAFLVLFSVKTHRDASFGGSLVALSTLVSIVTVPAVIALASALW